MTNHKFKSLVLIIVVFIFSSCSKDETNESDSNRFNDGEVEIVFENDPNGINVIFIGDRYVDWELSKPSGIYNYCANRHINHLFNTEPFLTYKQYFNAYIVYAESEEIEGNTIFEVEYASSNDGHSYNPSNLNSSKVIEYAKKAVPDFSDERDIILLSINRASGGRAFDNRIAAFGSSRINTMVHEVGHVFFFFFYEYFYREYQHGFNDNYFTYRANLDNTDNINLVKWKHFFDLDNYNHVNTYEGGARFKYNIWRPEFKSVMGGGISNNQSTTFNAPSREEIVKRIYAIKGLNYSFEIFLENDIHTLNPNSVNIIDEKNTESFSCGTPIDYVNQ